jgi:hypothetical protein
MESCGHRLKQTLRRNRPDGLLPKTELGSALEAQERHARTPAPHFQRLLPGVHAARRAARARPADLTRARPRPSRSVFMDLTHSNVRATEKRCRRSVIPQGADRGEPKAVGTVVRNASRHPGNAAGESRARATNTPAAPHGRTQATSPLRIVVAVTAPTFMAALSDFAWAY